MPILSPTPIVGRVAWLGVVRDRGRSLRAEPLPAVEARFEGLEGECHGGLTRPSCSRVAAQHPRGTEIRNARQVSILSVEELADIAARMGMADLRPEWLGANIVLEGIPDLTLLPPSSRLIFASGASVVVDMENGPCQFPAQEIEREHPGMGRRFKPAAEGRRGLVGWVERPGPIALGDEVRLHVPPLRLYPHLPAQARGGADQP